MNATLGVGVMADSLGRSPFMRAQGAAKWPLLTPSRDVNAVQTSSYDAANRNRVRRRAGRFGSAPVLPAAQNYAADRFMRRAFGCCRAVRRVSRAARNSA